MKPLHSYQQRAVKHLHDSPRAGLFMEMGLGKTRVVLEALTEDHLPALVIAPKRVAEHVWMAERDKWGIGYDMAIAAGTPKQRLAALQPPYDITIIGRENIADALAHGPQYKTVVLDELSGFKGGRLKGGVQRFKFARALTESATYVWGLTGTPAPNGLMDLWAQIFLLDRGKRLGKTITAYRDRYFKAGRRTRDPKGNLRVIEWIPKPGAEQSIHRKLDDICLSMRTEDYLDLPPITLNPVEVTLPASVMKTYSEMKTKLVADLQLIGAGSITAANAAVLTSKLSQINAGFLYDEFGPTVRLHDETTKAVVEIVEGTGSPVLVFYQYVEEADAIAAAIPEAKRIDDPGALDEWNTGALPVMLAHPASAGHGLNLQGGGHTIIWASLTWSLEEWDQVNGRLHRQGQEHPVMVHYLQSPGTVSTAKRARLIEKKSVQDALMDHLSE